MKKYIIVKDLLLRKFLSDKILVKEICLNGKIISIYDGFYIEHFIQNNDTISIINVENEEIFIYNNMFDISNNDLYSEMSIKSGKIKKSGLILEGPDGVGKTTLARSFADEGFLVQDREINSITKMMHKEISERERINTIELFLKTHSERKVIFLFLNESELLERINLRENINEYDMEAIQYLKIYREVFNFLGSKHNNLFRIDCDNSTVDDIKAKILRVYKYGK